MVSLYPWRTLTAVFMAAVFILSSCAQEIDPGFILLATHIGGVGSRYYTLQPDGTDLHLIHQIPSENLVPALSPDGQKILFFSGPDVNGRGEPLAIMNIDGTEPMTLTTASGHTSPPTWSPDGERVAYVNSNASIHVMPVDGREEVDLTQALWLANPASQYLSPIWSPDGQRLAFAAGGLFFGDELYIVNADGSNLTRLTLAGISNIECIQWGRPAKDN